MDENRTFPHSFPTNCPPDDASEADILVYRTVANNPPQHCDFLSWVEAGKLKPNKRPKCDECGISVMRSKEEAMHHRELFGQFAGNYIAVGQLTPMHGKTKASPTTKFPSHVDWWCYTDVARETVFRIEES